MTLSPEYLHDLVTKSLAEDLGKGDITTQALVNQEIAASATITLKQAGMVAGLDILAAVFQHLDKQVTVSLLQKEGTYCKSGTPLAKIEGPAHALISGERVALNLLKHASGVATITHAYVKKVQGTGAKILDTRKTLPGLRILEKYAVKVAGGVNHRFRLDDRFVIKTNHLLLLKGTSKNPIRETIEKVHNENPQLPIEIEVRDVEQFQEALNTKASSIMLNKMNPSEVKKCVQLGKAKGKKIFIESSGTITLETVRAYAETGIDGIAIGELTHSVPDLDISMRLF